MRLGLQVSYFSWPDAPASIGPTFGRIARNAEDAGLASLYVIGSEAPFSLVARFSWFPRIALAGFAALTIVAWLVQGPYFGLAYFAKGVELTLISLIVVDVIRVYGSPFGLVRAAFASIFGGRSGMAAA